MAILTHPATYETLLETPDDGRRYEIHNGELIVSPSPHWWRQRVTVRLTYEFEFHVRDRGLGGTVLTSPLDIRFAPHNIYQPDIVYVSPARRHILRDRMPVEGAPDLVVEVLSPSNRTYDQQQKAEVYARFGVLEYWIVDPEFDTIAVFGLQDGAFAVIPPENGRAVSRVPPGLTIDPEALFADLP